MRAPPLDEAFGRKKTTRNIISIAEHDGPYVCYTDESPEEHAQKLETDIDPSYKDKAGGKLIGDDVIWPKGSDQQAIADIMFNGNLENWGDPDDPIWDDGYALVDDPAFNGGNIQPASESDPDGDNQTFRKGEEKRAALALLDYCLKNNPTKS